MSVDLGFLGLGDLEDLGDDVWPGFAYAQRISELTLIGNGTDTGNVVIQSSAKGFREGVLSFTAETTADRDTARGYDEDSETVTFTDYDGSTCDVLVCDYAAKQLGSDRWSITVRLIQLTEPSGP